MSHDSDHSTDVLPEVPAPAEASGFRVAVVAGPDKGRSFILDAAPRVVGSADGVDLKLTDRGVSRRHLTLRIENGRVSIEDLGSTNGTYHLKSRIERSSVGDGARIEIGATTLEVSALRANEMPLSTLERYGELLGESLPMRRLFGVLERVERLDVPILLVAPTGTGKELVARALHDRGPRAAKPLVVFDCGAVAPELIESELFGHVKGSFTGAQADRAGVFEQAQGGTLLLDEIGELPVAMQTRLLRVLERGEVKRVGENGYRRVDVRVIAATHRDLEEASRTGTFRSDLFFRLAVVKIGIPTLEQRRDDIALLANHFAQLFGMPPLENATLARLTARDWPGNVRELRNAVQRILALGEAESLSDYEAPGDTRTRHELPYKQAREQLVEEFEARYVRDLLGRHNGNITSASREAQISRKHLHELANKHKL